jgi:hypothetical protein
MKFALHALFVCVHGAGKSCDLDGWTDSSLVRIYFSHNADGCVTGAAIVCAARNLHCIGCYLPYFYACILNLSSLFIYETTACLFFFGGTDCSFFLRENMNIDLIGIKIPG